MARLGGGHEEGDRLLGELLAEGDPLVHRERGRELRFLARLFLIDLSPLGLVTGGKKRLVRARSHRNRSYIEVLPSSMVLITRAVRTTRRRMTQVRRIIWRPCRSARRLAASAR